jgi:hypothetical protein
MMQPCDYYIISSKNQVLEDGYILTRETFYYVR